jgi:hypothetical protein
VWLLSDGLVFLSVWQEVEYLFPPCSFLEQDGGPRYEVTEAGLVQVVSVRVNANQRTMTVEELRGQKKQLHVDAFSFAVTELEDELKIQKDAFLGRLRKDRLYSFYMVMDRRRHALTCLLVR